MTKKKSKIVTTNQLGPHEDLLKTLKRYTLDYRRPISDYSYSTIEKIIDFSNGKEIVLDLGCGVGQSSFWLAHKFPNKIIVGLDKSVSRLERQNCFKTQLPDNCVLLRAELLDMIYLLYQKVMNKELNVYRIYLLYPNPYPKKIHLKKRFHANPIAPFLFKFDCPIIVRSNWRIYLEEFQISGEFYERQTSWLQTLKDLEHITPFEKKYDESGQKIFELVMD